MALATVRGIASDSASPTDTFIVNFTTPQSYYLSNNFTNPQLSDKSIGITTSSIFVKVFIDPDSPFLNNAPGVDKILLRALNYEFKFYKDVIKPILDFKVSPHFVRYYNIISGVNATQYANELVSYGIHPDNIIRNLNSMLRNTDIRHAIDDNQVFDFPDIDNIPFLNITELPSLKLNTLHLMPINRDTTMNLKQYLIANYIHHTILTAEKIRDLWIIYFQILQACHTLYISKCMHNDLHSGNIWVTTRPDYINLQYIIKGVTYNIKTNICVRLYDFDRSYSEKLGPNPIASVNYYCQQYSICNEIVKGKDFIKILCYILSHIRNSNIPNFNVVDWPLINFADSTCHLRERTPLNDADIVNKIPNEYYANFMYEIYFQIIYNNLTTYNGIFTGEIPDFIFNDNVIGDRGIIIYEITDCCV